MAGGTFFDRIDELAHRVGHGDLDAKVKFDQVYAAPQERGFWETGPNAGVRIRNHPGGGGSHFLRDAVINHADQHMQTIADHLLTDPVQGAAQAGHQIEREASQNAPVEFANLNRSGHVRVFDDGALVVDDPSAVPRLSRKQLNAQRHHGGELDYGSGTVPRLD